MRTLPRSARGTWLLAAAVWVGLCVLAWWAQTIQPRATWRLPEPGRPVGFRPDGRVLVTAGAHTDITIVHGIRYQFTGPFRLWDIASGQQIREFPEAAEPFDACYLSRTGRWLAATGGSDSQFLLDFNDGHWIAAPTDPPYSPAEVVFEPDDRWLLIRFGFGWKKFTLPDLAPAGECKEPAARWAVARNAAVVVATDPDDASLIRVWDAVQGRSAPPLRLPENRTENYVALSDDGSILAIGSSLTDGGPELRCWNLNERRELFVVPALGFPALGRAASLLAEITPAVGSSSGRFRLTLRELPAGTVRFASDLPADINLVDTPNLRSPDGRTLLFGAGYEKGLPFRDWAKRLGLRWPWDEGFRSGAELISAETGRPLGFVDGNYDTFCWCPDGTLLAVNDRGEDRTVLVWDVPPRKPLGWFALAAAILALPLAGLAWRRSSRLRRDVA